MFLKSFELLGEKTEHDVLFNKMNVYNTMYPFKIFPEKDLTYLEFEPITIFYGGNGSGKTTLLKVIADKINASKKNINDYGKLFDTYVDLCHYEMPNRKFKEIKLILSDDVFDFLLDLRAINSNVNRRKEQLSEEYDKYKYGDFYSTDDAIDQYEILKNKTDVRKMSKSQFIRSRLTNNVIVQESNGESALSFWEKEITDNAIYIIDEPENSLSAENQIKLKTFIEESARFYNCQFIMATHSPFFLNLTGAKIYDLDSYPVEVKIWNELDNVKTYYKFFKDNEDDFKDLL